MDYLAAILELSGLWLIGNRNRSGFAVALVGCLCWVAVSIRSGVYGLMIVGSVAAVVNVRNLWKWRTP